jgi:hypothetical protein
VLRLARREILRRLRERAPDVGEVGGARPAGIVGEALGAGGDQALAFGRPVGAVRRSSTASSEKLQAPISATAKLSCARSPAIRTRSARTAFSSSRK